jgi:hypothetical protein
MSKQVNNTEFGLLRIRAARLRDSRIAYAKKEFELTLIDIAKLEQDLTGKYSTRRKKISSSIESVIPEDREFSNVDILAGLEALEPGRNWRMRSIISHLHVLREKGLIRRVARAKNNQPAKYARAGLEVKKHRYANMSLLQVIEETLDRPMTQTELVVVIMENGYESGQNRGFLRNQVGTYLRTNPQFKRVGAGRWEKVGL